MAPISVYYQRFTLKTQILTPCYTKLATIPSILLLVSLSHKLSASTVYPPNGQTCTDQQKHCLKPSGDAATPGGTWEGSKLALWPPLLPLGFSGLPTPGPTSPSSQLPVASQNSVDLHSRWGSDSGRHRNSSQFSSDDGGPSGDIPSRLFYRAEEQGPPTHFPPESEDLQLIPFVSTFSHIVIPFHRIIKTNFSTLAVRCPNYGRYRLLSA